MDKNWVSVVIHHERYDTCRKCEHSEILEPDLKCNICGCLLLIMTRLKEKECPIGKWTKDET